MLKIIWHPPKHNLLEMRRVFLWLDAIHLGLRGSRRQQRSPTLNGIHPTIHYGRPNMFPASQASPAPVARKTFTLNAGTTTSLLPLKVAEKAVVCKSILAGNRLAKILAASIANSANPKRAFFSFKPFIK